MFKYFIWFGVLFFLILFFLWKFYFFWNKIVFLKDELNFSLQETNNDLIVKVNDWRKDRLIINSNYVIEGSNIYIELYATSRLIRSSGGIREITIGSLQKETYKVYYKNPDWTLEFIKEIELK